MSNITVTNYFITLLQIIDITNSYSFSFELTTNIIFSLTTLLVCNLTIFIYKKYIYIYIYIYIRPKYAI